MKTIVFIHGMFMNSKSWEHWLPYFEKHGYKQKAPDWPYHQGEPAWLRENISPELGDLKLPELVDYFADIIKSLPEKPVLIGHSMGGLVVQMLAERGLATAAVCISTAPPQGLLSFKPSFIKGNFPTINPLKGNSPCIMTIPRFHYTFCNNMTMEETAQAYKRYVVPETRNVARTSTGKAGKIDLKKPHVPLLFICGKEDNTTPSSLNRKNAKKYTDPTSIVDYKEFPGRTHFIVGQDNWEEVADYILEWLDTKAKT